MYILTQAHPLAMTDTLALIAFGMALFRLGFFSGAWSKQTYRRIALWGFVICVPLHISVLSCHAAHHRSHPSDAASAWLVLSHASLVVLFMQSGWARCFADRWVAVGRMAFSNYIAMSILCVLLFHGYVLGLYGLLERWQCCLIVPLIWAALLLWSKPWLEHHPMVRSNGCGGR